MDEPAALGQLELFVDAAGDPALAAEDLAVILDRARRPDRGGNPPTNIAGDVEMWQVSTIYTVGDVVTPNPVDGRYWMCVTPGTSDTTQPVWPNTDGVAAFSRSLSDNVVRWTFAGTEWTPTWDINAAAAEGWRIKAARAAGRFNFTTDGQVFQRAQVLAHCRHMERLYRRKITGGI